MEGGSGREGREKDSKTWVGVSQAEERAWEKALEWDTGCMRKGPRPAGRERLPLDGAEVDRNSHLLAWAGTGVIS